MIPKFSYAVKDLASHYNIFEKMPLNTVNTSRTLQSKFESLCGSLSFLNPDKRSDTLSDSYSSIGLQPKDQKYINPGNKTSTAYMNISNSPTNSKTESSFNEQEFKGNKQKVTLRIPLKRGYRQTINKSANKRLLTVVNNLRLPPNRNTVTPCHAKGNKTYSMEATKKYEKEELIPNISKIDIDIKSCTHNNNIKEIPRKNPLISIKKHTQVINKAYKKLNNNGNNKRLAQSFDAYKNNILRNSNNFKKRILLDKTYALS